MANNSWDPSVLGLTAEELSDMSDDEQEAFAIDALNRAADLLQNVLTAFGPHFRPTERQVITVAANAVIGVARAPRAPNLPPADTAP